MAVSCPMVIEVIVNGADLEVEERLARARKVMGYLSKTVGISKEDLPGQLKIELEKFLQCHGLCGLVFVELYCTVSTACTVLYLVHYRV